MSHHSLSKEAAHLPAPIVVAEASQLATLMEALAGEPIVAVDTESNSLYAYREQVCLIQISIPGADYLVDPLAGLDLAPLGGLLADPGVEKVFHAAEYDVMCIKRDFGFRFANLFDTMWAARILGWPRVGLGNVLEETFGVHTNKRYQRYNWGRRPLEQEAMAYAALDTHYLLPLRHLQAEALVEQGRWEEAREVFDQVAASEPVDLSFAPEDFWGIKGAYRLSGRQRAILRELAIWRDREARRRDRPHFKVLHDRVLAALARARPRSRKALRKVKGLSPRLVRRYAKPILEAVGRGMQARPPSPPPRPPRHSEEEVERFRALKAWRKRAAAKRGVDPDVVVGNAVLWALAERDPSTIAEMKGIEGLGPWKRERYGKAMLKTLRGR